MKIEIIEVNEHPYKPETNVKLIVDGKKKNWTMSNGLWEVFQKLIHKTK